jgi:hypothetical protein
MPASPSDERYKRYLSQIRKVKSLGSGHEVQAMYLLLDLERASIIWRVSKTITFNEVLDKERLCTPSRFRAFKRAHELFKEHGIRKVGLDAACLIAVQPKNHQTNLYDLAENFKTNYGTDSTYQYVAQCIRARHPKPKRPSYGSLKRRIEQLENEIRRLGHRVPPTED